MSKDKENIKERGYYSFGTSKVTGKEISRRGYSYQTASALLENLIAKKDHSFFSENETEGNLAITETSHEYRDKKGRNVRLSPFDMKLTTALAQEVDEVKDGEEEQKYIKELPSRIEDRGSDKRGRSIKLPDAIRCLIDIPQTAKRMYSTNRVGGKQIDQVRQGLIHLSEITQVFKFKDSRGGTLTIKAPLITLGKEIEYEKDGIVKFNKVQVTFEDVFVYEINERYSLNPITLLELWNKTGVQTELFTMLLFLLQYVRGNFIKHSTKIVESKRKELEKEGKAPEEIDTELREIKRNSLTYREGITSLLERIDTKKYLVNGKYIHATKLSKDLKQATEALKQMGIISDYYESPGASGEKICNFVINDRWIINEANKIRGALSNPEGLKKGRKKKSKR